MAELSKTTVKTQREVKVITYVDFEEDKYVLNLSTEEIKALFIVLNCINGCPEKSARKYIINILEELSKLDNPSFYQKLRGDRLCTKYLDCVWLTEESLRAVELP